MLGFDFPIGLPRAYATKVGVSSFPEFLQVAGTGVWSRFFDVADAPGELSHHRPFYPRTYMPKGAKQRSHLTSALGLDFDQLLRRCEQPQSGRRSACPLFWTCGGQQVGKGALTGWRLLQSEPRQETALWPFDGRITDLAWRAPTVIVETYPAEFYAQIGLRMSGSKQEQAVRAAQRSPLRAVAKALGVNLDPRLDTLIHNGFGPSKSGEDPFDAVVGLLGMLNVLVGRQPEGTPRNDDLVTTVEGWMLGQP